MSTKANMSGWQFELGDTASPPNYYPLEEVKSLSGFGKTNKLIDVTNWDSPSGTMEYIAGRADGSEITVGCNRIPNESPPTVQQQLRAAVDAQETRPFRATYVAVSPPETYDFLGVCIAHDLKPATSDANQIEFKVKISGDIFVS